MFNWEQKPYFELFFFYQNRSHTKLKQIKNNHKAARTLSEPPVFSLKQPVEINIFHHS